MLLANPDAELWIRLASEGAPSSLVEAGLLGAFASFIAAGASSWSGLGRRAESRVPRMFSGSSGMAGGWPCVLAVWWVCPIGREGEVEGGRGSQGGLGVGWWFVVGITGCLYGCLGFMA